MEKEENQNQTKKQKTVDTNENLDNQSQQETNKDLKEEIKEPSLEEKITELEDKVARTFAFLFDFGFLLFP